MLASNGTGRRGALLPLTRVCRALSYVAEELLYRRVSVGPHFSQLRTFLRAVYASERRTAAVHVLRIQTPAVIRDSIRLTLLQKLAGYPMYLPPQSDYNINPRQMCKLSKLVTQAFKRMVNLQQLDSNDLERFPEIFARSTFHLTELRTTGEALSRVTSQSSIRPRECGTDPDGYCPCPFSLVSIEKLEVDLFDPSMHLTCIRLLSVTHLFLDRCLFVALPDLRRSLPGLPNLLSLRIRWFLLYANRDISTLWPTHIVGDRPLPRLRRLQICEWGTYYAFVRPLRSCTEAPPINPCRAAQESIWLLTLERTSNGSEVPALR